MNPIPGKLNLGVKRDEKGDLIVFDTATGLEVAYQREVVCRQVWDEGPSEGIDVTVRFLYHREKKEAA